MLPNGRHHCCAVNPEGARRRVEAEPARALAPVASFRVVRRILGLVKALTPGAILVLLPKCPLCIVGYAAAAGIGLSVSTAENLRSLTFFTCLGLLLLFGARQIYLLRKFRPRDPVRFLEPR